MIRGIARKFFEGKKCLFCDNYGLYRLADKRVKCKHCNKYYSIKKLKRDLKILYYFYLEVSAKKTAGEMNLDYGVVHRKFMQFRKSIADYCNTEAKKLNGKLEMDESYFGGKRKGNRGRGANNKAIVFGILERKGRVHTVIVPNVSKETLMKEIENKTLKGSVFYTDGWKSYNSLHQFGKHSVIKHSEDEFAKDDNHINGIEGFWSYAKERFHKYHGIKKNNYPFYLKEMEFRFNNRNESVFNLLFDTCVRRRV
ncbi:MAG: IS1595 family transposase [Nanoarchaeota archaeon]|nr:IS1595 family transposase [Nanoarchaeota archaeon]MBU1103925.1 IS1595 family transposase [Nanoarchaeota archaeon]